ncbi:MAG: AMP-binding protein [Candidatus Helarchaeota archaeon]
MKEADQITRNSNQSIGTCLEQLAETFPKNPAIKYREAVLTWQELNAASNQVANYFLRQGLNPGESIALMLRNSPEYLIITCGINKIQGISGLINYNQKRQALLHSITTVNPKFLIIGARSLPQFIDIYPQLPYKPDQIFIINNNADLPHDFIELPEELRTISKLNPPSTYNSNLKQIAYYIFTSGTTGLPKAIKMSQKKLFTQGLFLGKVIAELTPNDVVYIATPLYHNLAIGQSWMAALLSGAAAAIAPRFSASEFWKDVHKYQVTYAAYVGEMPRYLLNQPPSPYESNHTLRTMVGIGLRKEIWLQFKTRFKIPHIYEYYGSTESHRALINVDEKPGMVGRNTMPGLVLAKVDPKTGTFYKNEKGFYVRCKPGDIGMALIKLDKSDFFARYKNEEKTRQKLLHNVFRMNDCYFNTGDLLQLHDDYWISFYDRTGDTFRWKGENVSTVEVESLLNSYPPVQTSLVFGVKVPNTEGKAGMAVIKLDPTLQFHLQEFSQFVLEVLPSYSIPLFLRLTEALELTGGTLKVKKTRFKEENYKIELISDPLYFWDNQIKGYIPFTPSLYNQLIDGTLKI